MKLKRLDTCTARYSDKTLVSYSTEVAGLYDNVLYNGSKYSAYVLYYYNSPTTCRHFHNFFKKLAVPEIYRDLYRDLYYGCQKYKKDVGIYIPMLQKFLYISSDPTALSFFNLAGRVGYGIIEHKEG